MNMINLKEYIVSIIEAEKRRQRTQVAEPDLSAYEKTKNDFDLSAYEKASTGASNIAKIKPKISGMQTSADVGKKQTASQTSRAAFDIGQKLAGQSPIDAARQLLQQTQGVTDKLSDTDIATAMQAAGVDDVNDIEGVIPTPTATRLRFQPMALTRIVKDIANRRVQKEGINVKWHEIRHLPGYTIQQIRGAFRPLFQQYMDNELEDVEVATTLTSPEHEVQKLVRHVASGGQTIHNFSLEAFGIDPEMYNIETSYIIRATDGMSYFIMREKLGPKMNFYVYRGKTRDSKLLPGKF